LWWRCWNWCVRKKRWKNVPNEKRRRGGRMYQMRREEEVEK